VILAAVGGMGWKGLGNRAAPPVEVELTKVHRGALVRTVSGTGKVQSATTVKISSNLSGILIDRPIRMGDRVTKDQVLAHIDRRIYEAAAKQARAGVSAAIAEAQVATVDVNHTAAELARQETLATKNMASAAEVEQARATHDGALARLASARERVQQSEAQAEQTDKNLSNATLRSPIEGSVIETSREVGERVRGSDLSEDVVMTLASLSAMEVRIEVSEHDVVHLKMGQKASVEIDSLEGQAFDGVVTEIAQNAVVKNPGTEAELITFPVKVALDQRPQGALPGMSAEVHITAERREDALFVPIQAVTVRAEKAMPDHLTKVEHLALEAARGKEPLAKVVFVVDAQHKARVRRVRTGISSNTDFEILEGLQDGDEVVTGPYRIVAKDLKDGDEVGQPKAGEHS
jgi:HlyD family secretion protein